MLQTIKKFFAKERKVEKIKSKKGMGKMDLAKGYDVAKQLREMAKLGGKLVL